VCGAGNENGSCRSPLGRSKPLVIAVVGVKSVWGADTDEKGFESLEGLEAIDDRVEGE